MEDLKKCPYCAEDIKKDAIKCKYCGSELDSAKIGAISNNNWKYKNKNIAGVLGLLLGGFGFHKFYLGKPIQGLFYLFFCWTFIPSIIGFLEGLNYLFMKKENFDKFYNSGK